ncbi:PTS-dependent dihydroxyacetone kinase, dihydroxyacetone-binding subunit dhaK [Alloiococcus otitis]|uniref:DhaK domain-containing protein n=1 Tax=Alloiococcus otitis ATCC 51267 TaxID=883081 RepID=K9EYV1_9LACT|nr:dihydroxyacetone kinase subunit DhaK [Alloiococcus otitis]EKU94355.1 hypothetical protein HMPREF9698_00083 [Alloiococcus otitis ATCC 51267]SUU81315.1 PTS-dependent dihydroxyacetone kinase, dihydroxyacetone-binding subunit dhaK [Alloiococcus otitis]
MSGFLNGKTDQEIIDRITDGIVATYDQVLIKIDGTNAVKKSIIPNNKVVLISGGGSGHEPGHYGYIGENMLDAAIMGPIFEPPSPSQIFKVIQETYNNQGSLLIIKNFEKDVNNFLEAEKRAVATGMKVDHVIVNDDCSIESSSYKQRKRGVAGSVLVHKILGGAASKGLSLAQLVKLGKQVVDQTRTLGVSFSNASTISNKSAQYKLAEDEMFFGIGIHGEPGYRKETMQSSERIALELTNKLIQQYKKNNIKKLAIMVNGLGSTPLLELSIFMSEVMDFLDINHLGVDFKLMGNFLTAYDTAGLSLTFVNLKDEKWLAYLNEPTDAFGWNH